MKKFWFVIGILCALSALAQDVGPVRKLSRRERSGGIVENPSSGRGRITFVNAQSKVSAADILSTVNELGDIFSMRVLVKKEDWQQGKEIVNVSAAKKNEQVVIALIDNSDLPISLIAPEAGWALVNTGALKGDSAFVSKEIWRTFAGLCGASDSMFPQCLMKYAPTAESIAAMPGLTICAEPTSKMELHLKAMGVEPYVKTSYVRACKEGWAPAPTNEIQKMIFERVKADKERGPVNPITIQPPAKK